MICTIIIVVTYPQADDTGVEEKDIELVMQQANVKRSKVTPTTIIL